MHELSLVVLAAGMGRRYGGLKQIDPVGPNGELIIDYSLNDAMNAGFTRVVFVIRRDIETDFERLVASRWREKVAVEIVFQDEAAAEGCSVNRSKPWGTGHAVLACEKAVEGPFAVINADDYYGASSYGIMAEFMQQDDGHDRLECALVGFRLADTLTPHGAVARGICRTDADGMLLGIEECTGIRLQNGQPVAESGKQLDGSECVSMNAWAFPCGVMPLLRNEWAAFAGVHGNDPEAEFYLPTAIDNLMRQGKLGVRVLAGGGPWFGVTHRADREEVVRRLAGGGGQESGVRSQGAHSGKFRKAILITDA